MSAMRRFVLTLGLAAIGVACASSAQRTDGAAANGTGALDDAFTNAANESGVPRDLLVAVARVEGGLAMPRMRDVDLASQAPVAGPLELRRGKLDTLARGAALVSASEVDIRRDTDLGLRAGALVLAELGRKTGARAASVASWSSALEDLSGYADDPHRARYAQRVLSTLRSGGTFDAREGATIVLAPHVELGPIAIDATLPMHTMGTLPEYPGAEVFPTDCTNKCDTTRGGNSVGFIVIHDTEGGWDASVATLQNDSGKSVQYIVDTDGTVGQFVPESYTAWHDGNYYYNQRSVGIEHVGYFNKTYPDTEYDASAKLVGYLTNKYSVPKDREHIGGHDQIPNGNVMPESSPFCEAAPATCETGSSYGGASNHRDPGDWEWCTYMPRFGGTCKCNDVWNLWNCSSDKTQAFRCANGKVELEQCTAGCVVEAVGVDDQCNMLPEDDAGVPQSDASSQSRSRDHSLEQPASNSDAPSDGSGGCAMTPDSSRSPCTSLGALLAGLFMTSRVLRRRRR